MLKKAMNKMQLQIFTTLVCVTLVESLLDCDKTKFNIISEEIYSPVCRINGTIIAKIYVGFPPEHKIRCEVDKRIPVSKYFFVRTKLLEERTMCILGLEDATIPDNQLDIRLYIKQWPGDLYYCKPLYQIHLHTIAVKFLSNTVRFPGGQNTAFCRNEQEDSLHDIQINIEETDLPHQPADITDRLPHLENPPTNFIYFPTDDPIPPLELFNNPPLDVTNDQPQIDQSMDSDSIEFPSDTKNKSDPMTFKMFSILLPAYVMIYNFKRQD